MPSFSIILILSLSLLTQSVNRILGPKFTYPVGGNTKRDASMLPELIPRGSGRKGKYKVILSCVWAMRMVIPTYLLYCNYSFI